MASAPVQANVDAEAALVGALLINNALIPAVAEIIDEADFYEPAHQVIFAAAVKATAEGKAALPPLLKPQLEHDEALQELGGFGYVGRLTGDGTGLLAPLDLAQQIRELAFRRRLLNGLAELTAACADPAVPAGEIATRLQQLPAVNGEGPDALNRSGSLLPYEWAGDVQPVLDGLWLIDDWLAKSGVGAMYGHPGSGKTFLATDIGVHVAEGREWAGRHVESGLVLYVVAEGQRGFRNRLAAMIDAGDLSRAAPFTYIPTPIDLQAPDGDTPKLIATLRHAAERAGREPALIIIDTLSKTFGGGKENSDDMASYIANCQRVASAFECLTLIVHHRPKDSESRDLRGHSSLRGGLDTAILVEDGETKTATIIKQKDGEEGIAVRFELERVVLGTNSRGKAITTCLVRIVDGEATAIETPIERAKQSLKGHPKTALRIIEAAIAKHGEGVPMEIPAAEIDRWKVSRVVKSGHVADTLTNALIDLIESDPDKKADTARRSASRAIKGLKEREIIGNWGEWLWLNS